MKEQKAELALLASENDMSSEQLSALDYMLNYLREKKEIATVQMIMKTSRLPAKNPKTFDNFDFSAIKGKPNEVERLKNLRTLSAIHGHKTLHLLDLWVPERHIWHRPSAMSVVSMV